MAGHDDAADDAELVDAIIDRLDGWRGEVVSRVRALIHRAEPAVVETVKWRKPSNPDGVPVWERDGIICTAEAYGAKVKLTFPHGASLEDPAVLFNASLGGAVRRAIDLREGDDLDEDAFVGLVREAVARNQWVADGARRAREGTP